MIYRLLIFFLLCCALELCGYEMKYGDFENIPGDDKVDASGWKWKNAWFCMPKDKYSKIIIDTHNMRTGQGALLIQGEGARAFLVKTIDGDFSKGPKMHFSFWCRTENMKGLIWVRVKMAQKDLANVALKSTASGNLPWTKFSRELTLPDNCRRLYLELYTTQPNNGKVWFDDFSLEEWKELENGNAIETEEIKISDCVVPLGLFPVEKNLWQKTTRQDTDGRIVYRGSVNDIKPLYAQWQFFKPWRGVYLKLRKVSGSSEKFKININDLASAWIDFKKDSNDYLIRRKDLVMENNSSYKGTITINTDKECVIEIEDLRIMPESEIGIAGAYINSQDGVYEPGCEPVLKFMMFNRDRNEKTFEIKLTLRNYSGQEVYQQKIKKTLKASEFLSSEIKLPRLDAGYFSSEISMNNGEYYGNGIIVLPQRPQMPIPRPFIGINKFGDLYPYTARYFVHIFHIHLYAGCLSGTGRDGKLSAEITDAIDYCKANGITPVGYLSVYPSTWHLPKDIYTILPDKKVRFNPKKFEEYAFQLAECLKNSVRHWELIGEIDQYYQRLENGISDYNEMVKSGGRGIRRAIPDAKITGFSVADPVAHAGWGMVKKEWPELKDYLSGVYADIYPFGPIEMDNAEQIKPETHLPRELEQLSAIVGPDKTIGVSEAGYKIVAEVGTQMWSYPMRTQGIMQVRAALITSSFENSGEYMVYHAHRRKFEEGWGMAYKMGKYVNPFPALGAYANCGRMLFDADKPKKIELKNPDIWLTYYRKSRGSMVVLWNAGNDGIHLLVPENIKFNAVDITGANITKFASLELGSSPVYLCFPEISYEKMPELLENFRFAGASVKLRTEINSQGRAGIVVKNISEQNVHGKLTVSIKSKTQDKRLSEEELTIASGEKRTVTFDLAPLDKLSPESVIQSVFKSTHRELISSEMKLDFYGVSHLKPGTISEMAAELKKTSPIILDSAKYVQPVHAIAYKYWQSAEDQSVKLWTGWNEEYFVVSAEITDKKHVQQHHNGSIWAQDCLHMAFETGNDNLPGSGVDDNDYEIGTSLSSEGPFIYGWKVHGFSKGSALEGCLLDISRETTTTFYNVAIPWRYIGIKPFSGCLFGFNFFIPNSTGEKTALYGMGLTLGINNGKDPGVFKRFFLKN